MEITQSGTESEESPYRDKQFRPIVRTGRPVARDGHSTILVAEKFMLLFGGDRHHMPFNDLQVLDLSKELDEHNYLFDE